MSKLPPCKRCNRSEPKDYGPGMGEDDAEATSLLLSEDVLAPGTLAWLCHNCRVEWRAMCCGHQLFDQYADAQFKLNHWKAVHELTGEGELAEGLELLGVLGKFELEMTEFANRFIGVDDDFT